MSNSQPSAFISDKNKGNFYRFNTKSMSIEKEWKSGAGSYPADFVSQGLIYVSTRGLESIQPVLIDNDTLPTKISFQFEGTVHKPRSTTSNFNTKTSKGFADNVPPEYAAVSGADKVYLTVIDAKTGGIVRRFGSGDDGKRRDYGGSTACGHPAWVREGVLLLDRINRRIELYQIDQKGNKPVATVDTPSSAHHVEIIRENGKKKRRIFAFCEGNTKEGIPPQVIEIDISKKSMSISKTCILPIIGDSKVKLGAHHLTIDVKRNRIYAGVSNGWLYHIDLNELTVQHVIKTGKGCGHVTICEVDEDKCKDIEEIRLAITTNHTDTYMSVFDLNDGNWIRDIFIATDIDTSDKKQGHTSFWDPDERKFYTTTPASGRFLEIDIVKGVITREIAIPGAVLIQGASPNSLM